MRREKSVAPRVSINADKSFNQNTTNISDSERHVSGGAPNRAHSLLIAFGRAFGRALVECMKGKIALSFYASEQSGGGNERRPQSKWWPEKERIVQGRLATRPNRGRPPSSIPSTSDRKN